MEVYSPETRAKIAIDFILEHEGELSNDPNDRGGLTNFGITLSFLKEFNIDINKDGIINKRDILNIDRPTAVYVYRKYIWDRFGYERIHDLDVAKKVADLTVNMGEGASHKILQRAVNSLRHSSLVVDGILGVRTIAATNMCDETRLLAVIKKLASDRYKEIVEKDPTQEVFIKGWLNRASA
jgi:lysozyme family protein